MVWANVCLRFLLYRNIRCNDRAPYRKTRHMMCSNYPLLSCWTHHSATSISLLGKSFSKTPHYCQSDRWNSRSGTRAGGEGASRTGRSGASASSEEISQPNFLTLGHDESVICELGASMCWVLVVDLAKTDQGTTFVLRVGGRSPMRCDGQVRFVLEVEGDGWRGGRQNSNFSVARAEKNGQTLFASFRISGFCIFCLPHRC